MLDGYRFSSQALTWLHFGDLHIATEDAPNHRDFRALIAQANAHLAGAVDFAQDFRLTVRVMDAAGNSDSGMIEAAAGGYIAPPRAADGSERDWVGAWPDKGIPGGQLGPNRNGRQW